MVPSLKNNRDSVGRTKPRAPRLGWMGFAEGRTEALEGRKNKKIWFPAGQGRQRRPLVLGTEFAAGKLQHSQ